MSLKNRFKHISIIYVCLFYILTGACSKETKPEVVKPPVVAPQGNPGSLVSLSADWVKQAGLMNDFPVGVEVYRRTAVFQSKTMNAYCVVFDPKSTTIEFKPVLSTTNKTLSTIYSVEPGVKYAAINGGFFGTNTSYSLVKANNIIHAVNIKSLNRPYNNVSATYFPTRGAFGITSSGAAEIAWIYHVGAGNGTIYHYPNPSPNELNSAPSPQPSVNFPAGGVEWNVVNAIGGSPVLMKDNEINISDKEELIDINNTTARARSAIGYTSKGNVIIVAVEGNNPAGGEGLNLRELAELMKDMGCVSALNLDGGGSTSMIINGNQTVKPSDTAGERPVISAIIIKKR